MTRLNLTLLTATAAIVIYVCTGCGTGSKKSDAGTSGQNALPSFPVSQLTLDDIAIRDPCIVADKKTETYYLYSATNESERPDGRAGVKMYKSTDLETWEGPFLVFLIPDDIWANPKQGVWAPEVHEYKGKYYLFATLHNENKLLGTNPDPNHPVMMMRGTQIFVSDSPAGPFTAFGPDAHTPAEWMALDGTLWEEGGKPYMIFCHEWVQTDDGTMEYVELKNDLSATVGEPHTMFTASEGPWVPKDKTGGFVTDGCYLYRTKTGKLMMIWSSFGNDGYNVATAWSESGKLAGPWKQNAEPLFSDNGGHGMLFTTFDGRLMIVLHQPNNGATPHAKMFELTDTGDGLIRK